MIPAIIWSIVFEVALPASHFWSKHVVADPKDVCCYFAGGLTATIFWHWYYGREAAREVATNGRDDFS